MQSRYLSPCIQRRYLDRAFLFFSVHAESEQYIIVTNNRMDTMLLPANWRGAAFQARRVFLLD